MQCWECVGDVPAVYLFPRLEVSEPEQTFSREDPATPLPVTPEASALPEGGQIVTLVQEEEEEESSSQSTVTLMEEEDEEEPEEEAAAPPESEEEQRRRETAQRESLFYCAHLSTLSCLASLQEKLYRWCSVTLALQRQRKERHQARRRAASAATSSQAPLPAQQALPAPTPTLTQDLPASAKLPEAEGRPSPVQGDRISPTASDAASSRFSQGSRQGEAGGVEHLSDPILLEPSRTSSLPQHSFTDTSLAKPTPTQEIPQRPTGEPHDQQQQRPGYLEQIPETQAEGRQTSSDSSTLHLHPSPTATSALLPSTTEPLSPEKDSPRLDLASSTEQPLHPLPTHTQPADIPPPTELPAPSAEPTDSGRPGAEELPHYRPLSPPQQQELPEAPALHADLRVEEAVEELLLSVPSAGGGHHRTATDFYAELQNSGDLPHGNGGHGNGNQVHGSNQKESVFMRLNNRIKSLEMNMSLSSRYLEELSQR